MSETGPRVLVVDDEQAIRKFLRVALTSQGFTVFEVSSGLEALTTAANYKPDIIILDLGLPDMDGIDVIRLFRQGTKIPIIILSVRGSENDKINALNAGADDYLTKPFSVGELLARLRANLRRTSQTSAEPVFINGDLTVDLTKRLVTLANREIQLTPTEYDLLKILVTYAGKVLIHHQLLREVWGSEYEQELHILHVNISNLRHKIEPDPTRPRFIITEPGVGYRMRTG
ncbi:MAG: response regulator [Chloroflexi bacterium]|nr:response regulator [Chloroflexota bacterium]